MKKENDVLFKDFFDFEVFVLPEKKSEFLIKKENTRCSILAIYFNKTNDPELEILLKNILSAVKLDIDKDIALLKTTPFERYSFNDIKQRLAIKDLLFFGIPPSNFGLNHAVKPYQPLKTDNLRLVLFDSLEKVSGDVKKKKALWGCLKELYLENQVT